MTFKSNYHFPNPKDVDPDGYGMIAVGGDLLPETLLYAYSMGLFPWFNEGEPIAWWSPEPRCIVYPQTFKPKKSLKKTIRKTDYFVTINNAFEQVMTQCAILREDTWISDDMIQAYTQLHEMGYAHSFEVWSEQPTHYDENQDIQINPNADLIGGLYGLKIGAGFFGESMFHTRTDCSKIAFMLLAKIAIVSEIELIDCQVENQHLMSLGAECISRDDFLDTLPNVIQKPTPEWQNFVMKLNHGLPARVLLQENITI